MNLSKAFDTLNHVFFIAKLHVHGFGNNRLTLRKKWSFPLRILSVNVAKFAVISKYKNKKNNS